MNTDDMFCFVKIGNSNNSNLQLSVKVFLIVFLHILVIQGV